MVIRRALDTDYQSVSVLFHQSDNYHSDNEPYIYVKTETDFRTKEYITELITNPQSLFLVLEVNQVVIGFLYAYPEEKGGLPIHNKRKILVIDNICISTDDQNKGYGQKLLEFVINEARELQYSDITLNVYLFNCHAISLYSTLGFKPVTQDMMLKL